MIDFTENPTRVGGLILDGISFGCRIVKIRLAIKDRNKSLIFNL